MKVVSFEGTIEFSVDRDYRFDTTHWSTFHNLIGQTVYEGVSRNEKKKYNFPKCLFCCLNTQ